MRLNKYIAQATGMSRRTADSIIAGGRVLVNGQPATPGHDITDDDNVLVDGKQLQISAPHVTILLNKPMGYVCSRDGQGSPTIYDLLPSNLHHLKSVGRLDKESSGLLLMTSDGALAHQLTHPSFKKTKVYKIALSRPLAAGDYQTITSTGVMLDDRPSKLGLHPISAGDHHNWKVTMHEGRNRQIRRTFEALGYTVVKLHRTKFGDFALPPNLRPGQIQRI